MTVQALLLAAKTPIVGLLTVGSSGGVSGFAASPLGSMGSLTGDAGNVNGRSVIALEASASGLTLYTSVTSNQALFKRLLAQNAAGTATVYFNSADATFVNNSPTGISRWTWASGADLWTAGDAAEVKRIGFDL